MSIERVSERQRRQEAEQRDRFKLHREKVVEWMRKRKRSQKKKYSKRRPINKKKSERLP